MLRVFLRTNQHKTLRGVNYSAVLKGVIQKIFQPAAGDHNGVSAFDHTHLGYLKRVVVQAGHTLGDQPTDTYPGAFTYTGCKLKNRKGRGGYLNSFLRSAGAKSYQQQYAHDP